MAALVLIGQIVGVVAGIAGALGGLYKLYKICKRIIKFFTSIADDTTYFKEKIAPIVLQMQEELKPNSGKSIKDQICLIEKLIRLNDARQKIILNDRHDPFCEIDKDGNCIYANKAFCDLFGVSSSKVLGKGWLANIINEERSGVYDNLISSLDKEIPHSSVYHIKIDSIQKEVEMHTYPYFCVKNEIIGYYAIVKNISKD